MSIRRAVKIHWMYIQHFISSTFYKQLLHSQIQRAHKTLVTWLSFLHFWDRVYKHLNMLVKSTPDIQAFLWNVLWHLMFFILGSVSFWRYPGNKKENNVFSNYAIFCHYEDYQNKMSEISTYFKLLVLTFATVRTDECNLLCKYSETRL